MMIVVRSRMTSRSPARILASVVASTEAVASSRIEDPGVDEERAGDRDSLTLSARERDAALADDGLVAVRQLEDELVCLRRLRGRLDGLVRRVGHPERDVVADRRGEEERIL